MSAEFLAIAALIKDLQGPVLPPSQGEKPPAAKIAKDPCPGKWTRNGVTYYDANGKWCNPMSPVGGVEPKSKNPFSGAFSNIASQKPVPPEPVGRSSQIDPAEAVKINKAVNDYLNETKCEVVTYDTCTMVQGGPYCAEYNYVDSNTQEFVQTKNCVVYTRKQPTRGCKIQGPGIHFGFEVQMTSTRCATRSSIGTRPLIQSGKLRKG